jgi:hypothetical protein
LKPKSKTHGPAAGLGALDLRGSQKWIYEHRFFLTFKQSFVFAIY